MAPAPDMIMAFINCSCKKGCKTNRCSCKNAQMSCSELCKCSSCENGDLEDIYDDDNDNRVPKCDVTKILFLEYFNFGLKF